MRILRFTFENEAKWILISSLGLPAIGALILLILFALRRF